MQDIPPAKFQSFSETAQPDQGPPRLALLRDAMQAEGLAGFMVPRADVHQGEYVAPCDERLAWLTGFTGSAGFCIALVDAAGVFIDGRYRSQAREQVDTNVFTPVDWPDTKPADWLRSNLSHGGVVGYDPWLYTPDQLSAIEKGLVGSDIALNPSINLIDQIWKDRPGPPVGKVRVYPVSFAGKSHAEKRKELGATLKKSGHAAAVITLTDSLAWLLNIRGSDIPRNPVPHGFAILHASGQCTLFINREKIGQEILDHLGNEVKLAQPAEFEQYLEGMEGPVRLDRSSIPQAVVEKLEANGVEIAWGDEPCALPKARKTEAEIGSTREAHVRDAAAMCEFLCWFDEQEPGSMTEIDVVQKLESFRGATGALLDISFDTIAGSGPHGALPHYRVTEASNRTLGEGELLVLDSGGQYEDGTTDITRTLPIGAPGSDEMAAFTRVLQGMIAMSRVRWPKGLAGRDLDVLARYPLWLNDQDYDHGTGHGVGVHLCVHEGPQRLSRISHVPLEPGMIVSNEPGYYREGAFGIRIENLVVVREALQIPGGDRDNKLCFESINFVPIDRRLVEASMLTTPERDWLNSYHSECKQRIWNLLSRQAQNWLDAACAKI
ncbi:MAG: aminopeptidase P family protein [Pseudomonadota bacterium]